MKTLNGATTILGPILLATSTAGCALEAGFEAGADETSVQWRSDDGDPPAEEEEEIECNVEYFEEFTGVGQAYDAIAWRGATTALDIAVGDWYTNHREPWLDDITCPDECLVRIVEDPEDPPMGPAISPAGCVLTHQLNKYGQRLYSCTKEFSHEATIMCTSEGS